MTCFGDPLMQRDLSSDRQGGNCISSVLFPEVPHATIDGIVTMAVSFLMIYPLVRILGIVPVYLILPAIAVIAVFHTSPGAWIDLICTRALYSTMPDFKAKADIIILQRVGASLIQAIPIAVIVVALIRRIA
jgi:hypothetical protein